MPSGERSLYNPEWNTIEVVTPRFTLLRFSVVRNLESEKLLSYNLKVVPDWRI